MRLYMTSIATTAVCTYLRLKFRLPRQPTTIDSFAVAISLEYLISYMKHVYAKMEEFHF